MKTPPKISLADQNADISEFEKNYEEAITQVKADTEKRLQEMKEEHDKYLKDLIEKRDRTEAQQKKEEAATDIENADRLLRSVLTAMLVKSDENDPAKTTKFIAEQFMHFANDIFLPATLPGYKIDCEFFKTKRTTIDGKKLPDDGNYGIRVILLDQAEYDERIEKLSKLPDCCGKCLASKHDISKISDAAAALDPNYIVWADAELDGAFSAYEVATGVTSKKKVPRLTATKLNVDTLRRKYNSVVEAIRKAYPSCQLLPIPDDATVGEVVSAVMAGAMLIRNFIKNIKARKASKKVSKKK